MPHNASFTCPPGMQWYQYLYHWMHHLPAQQNILIIKVLFNSEELIFSDNIKVELYFSFEYM